mmetsp:Transcript_21065/g.29528  ORF Transcript_21065/g.29528 Transcript_21065/m.29528 type:complete len:118 (+) Transcript_21065:115-468(+)
MRRSGNPRRDAIEYSLLIATSTVMCTALGSMLLLVQQEKRDDAVALVAAVAANKDGVDASSRPRKPRRIDLNAPLDLTGTWKEFQNLWIYGIRRMGSRGLDSGKRNGSDGRDPSSKN